MRRITALWVLRYRLVVPGMGLEQFRDSFDSRPGDWPIFAELTVSPGLVSL